MGRRAAAAALILLLAPALARADDDASCRACHAETWDAWRASGHASSASSPIFQADLANTPRAWCLGCHAPGVPLARVRRGLVDERHGVGCTDCHQVDDGQRPHPLAPELKSPDFCGRCHQFHIPRAGGLEASATPMQDTLAEWRASSFAARGVTCQSCHFPRGDHRTPGAHDVELLRRTFDAAVTRAGDRVHVEVRAKRVGHRAPTGDLTRTLELRLCEDEACARVVGRARLHRRFAREGDRFVLVEDTTLPPPATGDRASRAFTLDAPGARYWALRYRTAPQLEGELEGELEGLIIELARGALD